MHRWLGSATLWRIGLCASLAAGWWLAMAPGTGQPPAFAHQDKLQHAVAFAAYAVVASRCRLGPWWAWAGGLLLFGVAIEWGQSFTPDREPSVADVLADALGIGLGLLLLRGLPARLPPGPG